MDYDVDKEEVAPSSHCWGGGYQVRVDIAEIILMMSNSYVTSQVENKKSYTDDYLAK